MLKNNAMRPAFASVGTGNSSSNGAQTRNFVAFSASEDDDFNAFGDTSPRDPSSKHPSSPLASPKEDARASIPRCF